MLTYKLEAEVDLLERHVKVLKYVMMHQPVGIIKLSKLLNMPEHKIRYSLRLLEQEGLVTASPAGAKATEEAKKELENLTHILEGIIQKSRDIMKEIEDIENGNL